MGYTKAAIIANSDRELLKLLGYEFQAHQGFGACAKCCFRAGEDCVLSGSAHLLKETCTGGYYTTMNDNVDTVEELIKSAKAITRSHS
jgi:hypothetical protein